MPTPYPLRFEPIYKPKVWGGRRLEELGRALPGDARTPIGESWEVAELARTSPSGAGGGRESSIVANGPCRGMRLGEVWSLWGAALAGRVRAHPDEDFPLLVKLLDAHANLSLQVHPSERYARAHPGAQLKSEAWYVLAAAPGAVLYKGLAPGADADRLRDALSRGDRAGIEALLVQVPARAGDCHFLPSGTCHALGAGTLVLEVQDPSDTTFRLYDWGRTDRPLHVEQALECLRAATPSPEPSTPPAATERGTERLLSCAAFELSRRASPPETRAIAAGRACIWHVLEGAGEITGASFESLSLQRGMTILLPAGLPPASVHFERSGRWLEVRLGASSIPD